jgi:group II intron reverse transcriptase/maturase
MDNSTLTLLPLISERARKEPRLQFTSLAHLLDKRFLRGCYFELGRDRASGIDGVSWQAYGENLNENLANLVKRMKAKQYKPQPAKRAYIPKNEHEKRPLGLPSLEDKIVQKGISRILEAIYEQDFLDCSYGFRPGRSCHDTLRIVDQTIMKRPVRYVIEADIKGFFDNVSHYWLLKMLEVRVKDPSLLLLIRRFLKAGYIAEGRLVKTEQGTPQGGNLSPMLANIFLHYVLDLWFEKLIKPQMAGEVYLVRYADDFLIMTQKQSDAFMIEQALRDRFKKFSLILHPEKTRTISFSRKEPEDAKRQGRKPYTFEFLGFTHFWFRTREGWYMLSRRTSAKRFRRACRAMNEWLRRVRNLCKTKEWWLILASKLRGHYQYYGVSGNSRMLKIFRYQVMRMLHKWLNRRSQRNQWSWKRFTEYLEHYPLPLPNIVHKFY